MLEVVWYDQSTSCYHTCDLCFSPFVVAIRLEPGNVKSVRVHGIQVTDYTFLVGGVSDEVNALDTLRGIDGLKTKTDDQLKALTSVSTKIADHSILQALAYLPKL